MHEGPLVSIAAGDRTGSGTKHAAVHYKILRKAVTSVNA